MIIILLTALFAVAQEDYVVFEGAEKSYFVDDHPGSDYSWEVLENPGRNTEAETDSYTFTTLNNSHEIGVRWNKAGLYYLNVTETDINGCSNRKVMAVRVVAKIRTIAFNSSSSTICFNSDLAEFRLLNLLDDEGVELDPANFPVDIILDINGSEVAFQINYDNQGIYIPDSFMVVAPEQDVQIEISILQAVDVNGQSIEVLSGSNVHLITIHPKPEIEFVYTDDVVEELSHGFYKVEMTRGQIQNAKYSWWVEPAGGISSNLSVIDTDTTTILWDRLPGNYVLNVQVVDGNGCSGEIISQQIQVVKPDELLVDAGENITIGSCNSFQLQASVSDTTGLSYSWEPADNLDDATLLNPVFTPGNSTTFILTVTNDKGVSVKDTIEVNVSEVYADAGEEFMIGENSTALLNASASFGEQLKYSWTTYNGSITSGENTASPEINSSGTYYLEVSDYYGCSAFDSVVVSRIIYAPVTRDDYDTTTYEKSVTIPILANDEDPDNELDPSSLSIVQYPVNGSVYIHVDNYNVTYTPDDRFLGGDVFEYRICNYSAKCDQAHVYVYVTTAPFFIPEAFTPNGDNINDYFEILGIELYEGNKLTVMNRWGKKVYEAVNYGISTSPVFWDGKSNRGGGNGDVPTGTYFYVLDLKNGEPPIAGSVYIDR